MAIVAIIENKSLRQIILRFIFSLISPKQSALGQIPGLQLK
jgi:hypothetical protein